MSSLQWLMLICVFPGLVYQNQDLLGNVAWVPEVGVRGDWDLCHILRRMVIQPSLGLVLFCSWLVPGLNIYANLCSLFHKVSLMWVSGICGRFEFAVTL